MKRIILNATIVLALNFTACNNQNGSNSEVEKVDSNQEQITNEIQSYISMFEIPATDISRAINFYEALLDIKIEEMDIDGMQMGILPYERQMITGVIVQADGYKSSSNGVTLYLNAGENLQVVLDRVEKNGGQILLPKTAHADESGFFALFLDTEGNRLGLNSPD